MSKESMFDGSEWFETQRKFWDGWMKFTREGMKAGESVAANAGNGDETVWQQFYPWTSFPMQDTPPAAQDVLQKFLTAQRQYFDMLQHFSTLSSDGVNLSQLASDWVGYMNNSFSQAQNHPMGNHGALWDLFQDTWARTASSLSPFPGDFFRAVRPEGVERKPGDIHGHLNQFLAIPSVGYTRETQGQYQKMMSTWLEYQKTMHAYNAELAKVNRDALKLFQKKIGDITAEQMKGGGKEGAQKALNSVKDIYDLWVDACEEVYAEFAMSEEYTRTYGSLVNALMAVKKEAAKLADEVYEAMNMPTHKEVNTLHKRMHETRRETRKMKEALEDISALLDKADAGKDMQKALKEIGALREEIKALKAEMKTLKTKSTPTVAAAAQDNKGKAGKKGK